MQDTLRLTYINNIANDMLNELWQNCFDGQANSQHMNAHVPFPLTQQKHLDNFLMRQYDYTAWLIKRQLEQDIIGFAIHGNYFPGLPNNIGFNIGLNYIRNGFATETVKALIEYVQGIGLTETYGHCFETNIASIRTMEKCGFQNMGRTGNQFHGTYELRFRIQL